MRSFKGQLLLDGGKLVDTAFHRSVVLICSHDAQGAFGLVLNHPSEYTVGRALDAPLPGSVKHLLVFLGGPVQPQALSCLIHDPAADTPSGALILPGLHLVHSLDDLMEPRDGFLSRATFKFFAGYAGWSPGQLDHEMNDNAWLTHPASMELVFDPQTEDLWKRILLSKGPQYRLLAETPEDASKN
jgi:putative transcriptional regulator